MAGRRGAVPLEGWPYGQAAQGHLRGQPYSVLGGALVLGPWGLGRVGWVLQLGPWACAKMLTYPNTPR
jgi:hypothetical protein